jgi:hypothetical protein
MLQKSYRAILGRVEQSKKKMGLGDSDFRVVEALLNKGSQPVNAIGGLVDRSMRLSNGETAVEVPMI